jgi:hypothetical protein
MQSQKRRKKRGVDPSPEVAEGSHNVAKTVNRWREDFLRDFAKRMRQYQ